MISAKSGAEVERDVKYSRKYDGACLREVNLGVRVLVR